MEYFISQQFNLVKLRCETDFWNPNQGWVNSNQIKSTQQQYVFKSNQIKSSSFWESLNQIKSNHEAKNRAQIKSNQIKANHDLICISNQNFGRYQNQATAGVKLRFHRQIWHRSKALSELFLSVPLVSPESIIWIEKCIDNDFQICDQIKSNHGKRASNQITIFWKGAKSNQIKSRGLKNESNQIRVPKNCIKSNQFKSNQIMIWFFPSPGNQCVLALSPHL